jgi:DivIVA domain-containing protein
MFGVVGSFAIGRHTDQVQIEVEFDIVIRGYDRAEVDQVVQRVEDALNSDSAEVRASVRQDLHHLSFTVAFAATDRRPVDSYIREASSQLT